MLGKCKRILSLLCAIVILIGTYGAYLIPIQSIVNAAENQVLDLDEDVKYFGRTFYEYDTSGNKIYKFSWANSGFQFSFKGKGAEVTLYGYSSDEIGTVSRLWPRVKVYINGELATKITSNITLNGAAVSADSIVSLNSANENTESSENKNTLTISGLKEGNWTVKIVKCSDSLYNGFGLGKIQLRDESNIIGGILETQKYYDRQMLFIGDSLVTGLGNLVSSGQYGRNASDTDVGTKYSAKQEDTTLSFTSIAADAFGAENMTVANHYVGLVNNLEGDTSISAKDFFEYDNFYKRFNKRSEVYDHTQYDPDIIVINLGIGDAKNSVSANDYNAACKDFIMQVHTTYPNAKILYAYEKGSTFASQIESVIKDLNLRGYADIFCVPLTAFAAGDLITVPNEGVYKNGRFLKKAAHEVRAKELIRAVEDVTDWKSSISVTNPVTSDMPSDTLYGTREDVDISVMSFSLMQKNQDKQVYLDQSLRAPLIAQMIKSYMPDVICIQEASLTGGDVPISLTINNKTTTWAQYITEQLTAAGYDYRWLTQINQSKYGVTNMGIGNGLITFWKKDRFDYQASDVGRFEYNGAIYGRYWTWVQLKDKQNLNQSIYVYNTHIYNDTDNATLKNAMLQQVSNSLHNRVDQNGNNQPVIFGGDFILSFKESAAGQGLYYLERGYVKDAAHAAPYTGQNEPETTPNHIFFNAKTFDIRELRELYEGGEGRRLSSQEGIIAYFNYSANVSYTGGTLSDDKSEFNDVSNGGTYSFKITVGPNTTAEIYNDNGTAVHTGKAAGSHTLSLTLENKEVSHFTMRLKDGTGQVLNVVNIYITRTDIERPEISSTNTVNVYFANGAYHLLAKRNVVKISATGGELYFNPYATIPVTDFNLNLKQGRTVLYVKSSATGDVYPVYIYRQTHVQDLDTTVLYVDDDFIQTESGKVAFYDGERVIFVDASRAFATVEAAANAANKNSDCNTIYFGSGNYALNQNYNGALVKFTESVTLLGSNYDVSAIQEQADRWYAAGRKPESTIQGGFYFEKSGNINVTVKGFNFQGQTGYGALRFVDPANTLNSSIQTLDIQNNVFMSSVDLAAIGAADASDRGIVVAETQAQVTGIIKNNYFRCVQDNYTNSNKKAFTEALYLYNLHDMLIERNFFLGYQTALDICDVKEDKNLTTGTSYTVYSNRFESCGSNINRLFGVGEKDKTYIAYRNNDFVRCGSGNDKYRGASFRYAIDLYFDESEKGVLPGKYFENITVDVTGNRFIECSRSFRIRRTTVSSTLLSKFKYHNVSDMTVNFNKNSIINPLEYSYAAGYFHSVWLTSFSNGDMKTNASANDNNDKWDFSGNYCYTPFYDKSSKYFQSNYTSYSDKDIYTESNYINVSGPYDLRLYMQNYPSSMSTTNASITLKDSNFASKVRAYDRVVKAFDGAVGSFEEGWKYDFDHISLSDTYDKSIETGYEYDYISDIADMDFLRGTTPLSDKMTALDAPVTAKETKKIANHSMLTTEHLTGEMRGLTSFYSDVRWYCKNKVSFDIRTTYTGNEASFFYKYSNGAMPSGTYANISNEIFYNESTSEKDVDGIMLKFKTDPNTKKPTIILRVYKTDGSYVSNVFTDDNCAVTDMTEFNHIDIIEKEIGTMDFYVNGKRFARVVGQKDDSYTFTNGSIANTTNTASNAYYNSVVVYRVDEYDVPNEGFTIDGTSVAKQTAIAFSSSDTTASTTANEYWPQKKSMEIDSLEIIDLGVSKLTIVNNIDAGILYKAWNMTDCVYDEVTKSYIYTINKDWIDFFNPEEDSSLAKIISKIFSTTVLDGGKILLTYDRGGNSTQIEHDNEDMVLLAKAAVQYAIDKKIPAVGAAVSKPIEFSDEFEAVIPIEGPGYFVVNSTLGSLITTDTYDNKDGTFNLTVYEKNDVPVINKYALEGEFWRIQNDSAIGKEIQFKLLVTVQDGAYGYTIKDLYGEYFDFVRIDSVKEYAAYINNGTNVVKDEYVVNQDYVIADNANENTFTLKFASADAPENSVGSLEDVPTNSVLEVIYTVKVNKEAPTEVAIPSSATLSYGRIDETEPSEELHVKSQREESSNITNTYLWSLRLYKYTESSEDKNVHVPLAGAKFALCTNEAGTARLSFIKEDAGVYRLAAEGETGTVTELETNDTGLYTIKGLDSGDYYVLETASPAGYGKMLKTERISISVGYEGEALIRSNCYTYDVDKDGTNDVFAFVNYLGGSVLPSTGATGRIIFVVTGSVIVLSMGILLITRMRSSKVIFEKSELPFEKL